MGARIGRRRRELGLSQAELGARIGVSHSQISKYEAGTDAVPMLRLSAIAGALGTSSETLMGGSSASPPLRLAEEQASYSAESEHERTRRLITLFKALSRQRQDALLGQLTIEVAETQP